MLKTIVLILLIIGNFLIITKTFENYKKTRERLDLLELIGLGLILPSLIILLIGQFI